MRCNYGVMSYCETCSNKGTTICLDCKSWDGVPDKHSSIFTGCATDLAITTNHDR